MSATIADSLSNGDPIALERQAVAAERDWLFKHVLPRALNPIREGLKECSDLLHNANITLPITSRENERLKGIMTRQGSQLVKGDLLVKMDRLRLRLHIPQGKHVHLQQIEDVNSLVHYSSESLEHDLYQDTARRIVADVLINLNQATDALTKHRGADVFPLGSLDSDALRPTLPAHVALDLYIQDASLVSEIRILQTRGTENFLTNLIKPNASETGEFVRYKGEDFKIVEHVRVESQDPALIAVSAKLMALKHGVQEIQKKLLATEP